MKPERWFELLPTDAMPIDAAPGTVVHCLMGTIWLTQDGMSSDRILIAGMSFVSGSSGKIVVSSPSGASVVHVYHPETPSIARSALRVDYDVVQRVERAARRARQEEIGRWMGKLADVVASVWHAITHDFQRAIAGKQRRST